MKIYGSNHKNKTEMKKSLLFTILLSLGIAVGLNAQIPTDGLVASYPFNGNANDESGNGLNGTVNEATLTTDRFGNANNAYSFDGISSNIMVSNDDLLNVQSGKSITISCWVKHDLSASNVNTYIISKYGGLSSIGAAYAIGTGTEGNSYSWHQIDAGNANGREIRGNSNINDGNWHHFVSVNSMGETVTLFVDGVVDKSEEFPLSGSIMNALDLYFGCGANLAQFYKGSIDDIRIYNRKLEANEIKELYQEGGWTSLNQGLVAHYPFNGNANDESGNGNDGTVNGATLTADRFGNANSAYSFDGASNYIQCVSNITNIDTITISGWAKSNSPSGGHFVHIGEDDNDFCTGIGVGKGERTMSWD